jgi:O-antigen/teichoic acid export membrane protein
MASLFRNTLAQGATFLTSQLFSFLLAPIMIARLGLTLFGVWTVVGAIAAYATILDAGITRALARFIALFETQGDEHGIKECVTLGVIAFTLIGVLLLPLAWFAAGPLATTLGHLSTGDMRQILLASTVIFLVQGYSAVLQALPQGLRRMVPPNAAVVAGNVVNFAASLAALLMSRSLVRYAWFNAGAEAVSAVFVLVSVFYVWHHGLLAVPRRDRVREILGFSLQSQLSWISDLINLQSDKIVIGLLVSPRAAGTYQLGSAVAGAIRAVGVISISAMIPTATAMIASEGRDAVRRLARHYLPRVLGVSLPIFAVTAMCAPFLFMVWIGRIDHGVVAVVIALNVAYAVNIATGVPSTLSIADGRPGFVSRNSLWMAGLNLVLTLALAPVFGLGGVVAGTVIAVTALSAVFVVSFARSYGLGAREVLDAVIPPALLAAALTAPFVPLVVATTHLATSRVTGLLLLAAIGGAYAVVYWPLASWLGLLPHRLTLRRRVTRQAAY